MSKNMNRYLKTTTMKNYLNRILFPTAAVVLLMLLGCGKKDTTPPPTPDTGTVTDVEGNVYKTIKIGTQVWMAENLKVTKFRNGASIPLVSGRDNWYNLPASKSVAYCNSNDDPGTAAIYGRLYNWYAVNDSRGLAPAGWHVPSLDEYLTLMSFLGGKPVAGGKMKEAGTAHWLDPNNADNSSGFTALFVKTRTSDGNFWGEIVSIRENNAYWWTSTVIPDNVNPDLRAYWMHLYNKAATGYTNGGFQNHGLSVRCVKD
jgi:uncharacterized protein (TIGR02145 family)